MVRFLFFYLIVRGSNRIHYRHNVAWSKMLKNCFYLFKFYSFILLSITGCFAFLIHVTNRYLYRFAFHWKIQNTFVCYTECAQTVWSAALRWCWNVNSDLYKLFVFKILFMLVFIRIIFLSLLIIFSINTPAARLTNQESCSHVSLYLTLLICNQTPVKKCPLTFQWS